MIRLRFRCTDHGQEWTDIMGSKADAFQMLADAARLTQEGGVEPCKTIILEMTEVELDDLTPAERAELAEDKRSD